MVKELYKILVYQKMKNKIVRLIAQDSTDISAFSSYDKDAKYGHRTPSKKEQRILTDKSKTLFFGYKLHVIADVETEIPIATEIVPANRHDTIFFHKLYGIVKNTFHIHMNPYSKFLADLGYDATDIYQELHYDNIKPVIAINGRGFYKSSTPFLSDPSSATFIRFCY